MTEPILPPLKPIPIKDRISVVYIEKCNVDILDRAFVVVDKTYFSEVVTALFQKKPLGFLL